MKLEKYRHPFIIAANVFGDDQEGTSKNPYMFLLPAGYDFIHLEENTIHSPAADKPVAGGLSTFQAGVGWGCEIVRQPHISLIIGGALGVSDFGITLPYAAEKLFAVKGYEDATVNDIFDAVQIAKGKFYYHFKSKEDVLDGIVKRQIDAGLKKAQAIAANPQFSVEEKLLSVILAQKLQKTVKKKSCQLSMNLSTHYCIKKLFLNMFLCLVRF